MTTLFVICAVLGGTILVCQIVLTIIGLGGDALHVELPQDMGHDFGGDVGHDFGGDMGHDVGGDMHGDAGGDMHGDAGGDVHGDAGGDAGHAGHAVHAGQADASLHHGSLAMFRILSFRSVVAALTFFGLAGLAAHSAEVAQPLQLAIAGGVGFAAMYGVYWVMQTLYGLKSEGTVRVERAVGHRGTVYLRIPGAKSGVGKIHLNLQNRTMEYQAVTAGPELPTGASIVVVDLIDSATLEVALAPELERNAHA